MLRVSARTLPLTLLLASCTPPASSTPFVEDTAGVRLELSSSRLVPGGPGDPGAVACGETTGVGWRFGGGRLITLCPSLGADAVDCRPLLCTDVSDCPEGTFSPSACEDGFCVLAEESLRDEDVVSFCVRDLPRNDCSDDLAYATSALALVGTALERHCDGSGECTPPIRCGE